MFALNHGGTRLFPIFPRSEPEGITPSIGAASKRFDGLPVDDSNNGATELLKRKPTKLMKLKFQRHGSMSLAGSRIIVKGEKMEPARD